VINRLEDVTVPTIAAVRGYCVGAGLPSWLSVIFVL
jgi:enoyl-CoA hydratase/carnithine racemase